MTTDKLIDDILESYRAHPESTRFGDAGTLNRDLLIEVLYRIREILFPGYYDKNRIREEYVRYAVGEKLEFVEYNLTKQIAIVLGTKKENASCPRTELTEKAGEIVRVFLQQLPVLREVLATDIEAAFNGDPAAYGKEEIILSYPGLFAITVYRVAHELWIRGVPLIPRVMTEHAHNLTGIDIHPGATVGKYFFIDHGTGIVIGETTTIGDNVKIYQGVTLGGLSTRKGQDLQGIKRHPTIGNHVTIYSGASILGGETVIGDNVTVGGNTFIIHSIPANTRVSAEPPALEMSSGRVEDFSDCPR
ncbi:MAG: serine acetyltransferase [Eubacterium sp.]|nr:serine acetyltransferase [Eubacterium sp.]